MGATLRGFIPASLTFDIYLALTSSPALFHSFRQTVNNSSPVAVDFHNGPVFLSPHLLTLPVSRQCTFLSCAHFTSNVSLLLMCISVLPVDLFSLSVRSSRPAEEHSHREAAQHGGPSHCPHSTLPTIRE